MANSQSHFEAANKAATTETDKANLKQIQSFMDEEHATFKNALYSKAESLARKGANGNPDPENEKSLLKFAEAAGMGDDLKLYLKEEVNSKYEFGGNKTESKPAAAENKTTVRQGPNTKTLNETPAEHIKKNWDAYKGYQPYDMEKLVLGPSGYEKTDEYGVMGGGKRVQYEKEGGEKIALFFDENGELDDYEIEASGSKPVESNRENRINEYWRKIRKETHPVARMAAELDRGTFDDDVINTMRDGQSMEDLARSLISPAFEDDGYIPQNKLDTARKLILKRYKALESDATDSAPRVLTGDTRIRIRKA